MQDVISIHTLYMYKYMYLYTCSCTLSLSGHTCTCTYMYIQIRVLHTSDGNLGAVSYTVHVAAKNHPHRSQGSDKIIIVKILPALHVYIVRYDYIRTCKSTNRVAPYICMGTPSTNDVHTTHTCTMMYVNFRFQTVAN